jgi:hypothetical protein
MMHRLGYTGKKASSDTPYCWAVWEAGVPRELPQPFDWKELLGALRDENAALKAELSRAPQQAQPKAKPPGPPELQKSPLRRFERGEALAAWREENRRQRGPAELLAALPPVRRPQQR